MLSIACVGASVLDISALITNKIPDRGSLTFSNTLEISCGGCAMNVAMNLSKLGIDCKLITKVGNDIFGNYIANKCNELNIELYSGNESELKTSLSLILLDGTRDRRIVHHMGVNKDFCEKDIDLDLISQYEYVYFGGVLGMPLIDEQLENLFLELKNRNKDIKIILDIIYSKDSYYLNKVKEALKYVDFFIPNYSEAKILSGKELLTSITDYFMELGVKNIIVTLGEEGVFYKNDSSSGLKKALSVNVQDTTGAGDAFASGFIYGLLKTYDFETAIIKGLEVSAQCVSKIGCMI